MQQLYKHSFRNRCKSNPDLLIFLNSSFLKSYPLHYENIHPGQGGSVKEKLAMSSQPLPMPLLCNGAEPSWGRKLSFLFPRVLP